MSECPCRDRCPSLGPEPVCFHGWFGPLVGRAETRRMADGRERIIFVVSDEACARCEFPGKAPTR